MSLLWPSQLLVGISQHSVAMLQLSGLSKRVQHKQHVQIATPEQGWNQALSQLQTMLTSLPQPKPKVLRVVLASDFVRYLALPSSGGIMRNEDKIDFARAAYKEVYGNMADAWQIQCDDAAPDQASLSAAVDKDLIEALTKLAQQHDMRLTSVQPQLMPVFNRSKAQLGAAQQHFALVESGRLLFSQLKNGHWQKIRSFALESDWTAQLKSIAQRENMSNGAEAGHTLLVYAPHDKACSLPHISGWTIQRMGVDNRGLQGLGQPYAMLEAV